jgi:CRP-like cAMP-binding protein
MRKGEQADRLFYLVDGQIQVVEIRKTLSAGTVIGEIGVFARHQQQIATVVCLSDCELYELQARLRNCITRIHHSDLPCLLLYRWLEPKT